MAAADIPFSKTKGNVLVASTRANFRKRILQSLAGGTVVATEAAGGADALAKLGERDFRTLLLDSLIEDLDVEEVVATLRGSHPQLNIVVLDPQNSAGEIRLSLPDPIAESAPAEAIDTCSVPTEAPPAQVEYLPEPASPQLAEHPQAAEALQGIIGTSHKMQHVYRLSRLVAPRSTGVLIVGATGTGKELVARAIHELSPCSGGPFIVVNCAAIPESLLEAELFGFTRGAFTGAFQSRLGRIHAAHNGTLLLDEVGELPLSMQAKLLRFVQEGEVQRLGSADVFRVSARLIAATNADLFRLVREKQFREDLYYRLAVFPIHLPPLCDRSEDILPLAQHFLSALAAGAKVPPKSFSLEAAAMLQKHSWPGNVRELQHRIERGFIMAGAEDQIRAADLCMSPEAA